MLDYSRAADHTRNPLRGMVPVPTFAVAGTLLRLITAGRIGDEEGSRLDQLILTIRQLLGFYRRRLVCRFGNNRLEFSTHGEFEIQVVRGNRLSKPFVVYGVDFA